MMNNFNKLCVLGSLLLPFLMSSNISFAAVTPGAVINEYGMSSTDRQCCVAGGELKVGAKVAYCYPRSEREKIEACQDGVGCKFTTSEGTLYAYDATDTVTVVDKGKVVCETPEQDKMFGTGKWVYDESCDGAEGCNYHYTCRATIPCPEQYGCDFTQNCKTFSASKFKHSNGEVTKVN